MVEGATKRRKTWSSSLGPLSGQRIAVQEPEPELVPEPFTQQELTLLDHEVGILGHILWTSHNRGLLPYSGINLDSVSVKALNRIAVKYRPFLLALDPEELLEATNSVDNKLSRARDHLHALDQANPLVECADGRGLIRMIRPVLPGIHGVKNLLSYYHLSQEGKL